MLKKHRPTNPSLRGHFIFYFLEVMKNNDGTILSYLLEESMRTNLLKFKRFFIIDRINAIVWDNFSSVLFPDSVCREAIHVYFYICTNFLVCQHLTTYDLIRVNEKNDKHHFWWMGCEWMGCEWMDGM